MNATSKYLNQKTMSESENKAWKEEVAAARLNLAAPNLLAALKLAYSTIQGTLDSRGYKRGSDTSNWIQSTKDEVASLVPIRAAIANAEGAKQS